MPWIKCRASPSRLDTAQCPAATMGYRRVGDCTRLGDSLSAEAASWWTAVPALRDCQAQATPLSICSRPDGPILSSSCGVPGAPGFARAGPQSQIKIRDQASARLWWSSSLVRHAWAWAWHGSSTANENDATREAIGRSLVAHPHPIHSHIHIPSPSAAASAHIPSPLDRCLSSQCSHCRLRMLLSQDTSTDQGRLGRESTYFSTSLLLG
ncbi:hypothetical protein F5B22DRAFT_361484 [Xylaria bambusicola]|uniref:uncharacterized protein n=1 Tax=Xylaria bambusicola TaxID=326684 RepID=UPI00200831D5|nr:uncharacterized protein F5B22DRAFT_361484 [Xylaria bambusicola]KAI0509345.1 hypothetical protein F5B22DRAFT_361484 [Xylaria bambusicola]